MAWEKTDANGNRQGLTIAEKGEVGGPGMGGCPVGPTSSTPSAGQFGTVWGSGDTAGDVKVSWAPVTAEPGASPVQKYLVEAIAKDGASQEVKGVRVGKDVTTASLTGLTGGSAAWDIEVRTLTE